mmetsp:Transcript_36541/g.92281  ORF Transcript_36541/g.92281 Transcript_36541/m.92281 type:complete len:421 (-) Transcript_36541:1151-2413(-)
MRTLMVHHASYTRMARQSKARLQQTTAIVLYMLPSRTHAHACWPGVGPATIWTGSASTGLPRLPPRSRRAEPGHAALNPLTQPPLSLQNSLEPVSALPDASRPCRAQTTGQDIQAGGMQSSIRSCLGMDSVHAGSTRVNHFSLCHHVKTQVPASHGLTHQTHTYALLVATGAVAHEGAACCIIGPLAAAAAAAVAPPAGLPALLAACGKFLRMNDSKLALPISGLRIMEGRSGLMPMMSSMSSAPPIKPVWKPLAAQGPLLVRRPNCELPTLGSDPKLGVVPRIIISSFRSSSGSWSLVKEKGGGSISSFLSDPRLDSGSTPPPMSCVHTSTMSTLLPYMGDVPIMPRSTGDRPMPPDPSEPAGGHSGSPLTPMLVVLRWRSRCPAGPGSFFMCRKASGLPPLMPPMLCTCMASCTDMTP